MNAERIEKIRKRAESATPGPWEIGANNTVTLSGDDAWVEVAYAPLEFDDVNFIAHAREDIPALLAEVERLRKQNAELLEWNRYYLEVTKERRKEVAELREEISEARSLLSDAHDLMDDVHCYDTDEYTAISKYLYGDDDDE